MERNPSPLVAARAAVFGLATRQAIAIRKKNLVALTEAYPQYRTRDAPLSQRYEHQWNARTAFADESADLPTAYHSRETSATRRSARKVAQNNRHRRCHVGGWRTQSAWFGVAARPGRGVLPIAMPFFLSTAQARRRR